MEFYFLPVLSSTPGAVTIRSSVPFFFFFKNLERFEKGEIPGTRLLFLYTRPRTLEEDGKGEDLFPRIDKENERSGNCRTIVVRFRNRRKGDEKRKKGRREEGWWKASLMNNVLPYLELRNNRRRARSE